MLVGTAGEGVAGDHRDGGGGQRRRAEQQVAVAALKRAFLAHGDAGFGEALARDRGRQVAQGGPAARWDGRRGRCFRHACRTARNSTSVRPWRCHQIGDLQAQPFDQIAGGGLADIAAGIAIAELQSQAAEAAQIGAVMRAAQGFVQDARAMFQSASAVSNSGLISRRSAMPKWQRQPQGGQQRGAGFRLGDQEPDIGGGIYMFHDLRDRHDQACVAEACSDEQRAEIDGDRAAPRSSAAFSVGEQRAAVGGSAG